MAIVKSDISKIVKLNKFGEGVFIKDGKEYTISYTLPNEIVRYDQHAYRKNFNCILKEVLKKSPHRILPDCKYFSICGGCTLQHLNKDYYSILKKSLVEKAILKFFPNCRINDIITVEKGQRRRVKLVFIKKNQEVYLGFKQYKSEKIVNIDYCIAATKTISNLLKPLKVLLAKLNSIGKGVVHITEAENGLDLLIEYNLSDIDLKILEIEIEDFCQSWLIARFSFKDSENKLHTIYEKEKPYILLGKHKINILANSFLQSTKISDLLLPKNVSYLIDIPKGSKILDLFCGRGTFALFLADLYEVYAVDSDLEAVNELQNAAYLNKSRIKTECRDLFKNPLSSKEISEFSTVVINPPRCGAKEQILQISKTSLDIIYVSCKIESFIKDAIILKKKNFFLETVIPVDQFYWTSSIEIIAKFKKNIDQI